MAEPIQSSPMPGNAGQGSSTMRLTPEPLQEMLPPSIATQQQRMADATRKVAWTTGLSALAGAVAPMAFPQRIAKSVPLRLFFSALSAIGAGVSGAITSGYFLMKRVDRENRETFNSQTTMAPPNETTVATAGTRETVSTLQAAPVAPLAPESTQAQSPTCAAEPPRSSFAGGLGGVAARDASFVKQAETEAAVAAVAGAGVQMLG